APPGGRAARRGPRGVTGRPRRRRPARPGAAGAGARLPGEAAPPAGAAALRGGAGQPAAGAGRAPPRGPLRAGPLPRRAGRVAAGGGAGLGAGPGRRARPPRHRPAARRLAGPLTAGIIRRKKTSRKGAKPQRKRRGRGEEIYYPSPLFFAPLREALLFFLLAIRLDRGAAAVDNAGAFRPGHERKDSTMRVCLFEDHLVADLEPLCP